MTPIKKYLRIVICAAEKHEATFSKSILCLVSIRSKIFVCYFHKYIERKRHFRDVVFLLIKKWVTICSFQN